MERDIREIANGLLENELNPQFKEILKSKEITPETSMNEAMSFAVNAIKEHNELFTIRLMEAVLEELKATR